MRTILSAILLGALVVGCGGGSGGGNPGNDANNNPTDGSVTPPDGTVTPPPASALGTTCTPDQANPQGDCPTGFTCLSLQGGTNAWCSKQCTSGAGDTCAQDYDGPGKAACIFSITPAGGGTAETFCAVICEDDTGQNQVCAPTDGCDGTCPGTLACSAALTSGNTTVGKACQ